MAKDLKIAELDAERIKHVLRHYITTNRLLHEANKKAVSVNLVGPAGLGKTSIGLQIGDEFEMETIKLNLAELDDIGDLVGFPMRQFEMILRRAVISAPTKEGLTISVAGHTENTIQWVDEIAVEQFRKQGYEFTGNHRKVDCPPDWIAGKTKPIFLILDDYTRADNRFLQATMTLIDRQEYAGWKLPKGSTILLTTNPSNGDYIVNELDDAQKTRFTTISMKWDAKVWGAWAEKEGIDSRAINFVLYHPEIVEQGANPRSLTNFFNSISSIKDFENELNLIQIIGEGAVGVTVTTLFTTFIGNRMDKIISPQEILENADKDYVFKRLKDVILPDGPHSYRSDIASILSLRILNYSLYLAEKKKVTPKIISRLIEILTSEKIFAMDITYNLGKKLYAGNKVAFNGLVEDKIVQTMLLK